jgi:hypothetical protein
MINNLDNDDMKYKHNSMNMNDTAVGQTKESGLYIILFVYLCSIF